MKDETLEERQAPDLPWLLAGSFIVLLAGFAFIVFSISFVAGFEDVRFLGKVAAFTLIFAVAMFAILIFVASNEFGHEEDLDSVEPGEADAVGVTKRRAGPPACPNCGQANPEAAKFCYRCGIALDRK